MKTIEIKKIQKAKNSVIGSVIGNLVSQTYLPGIERKSFKIEDFKSKFLKPELKKFFGIELLVIENLGKCEIEMIKDIEETEVKLIATFAMLLTSPFEDQKELKVSIFGKKSFRKQSKKIAYDEFYNEFMEKVKKTERIIEKANKIIQDKLDAIQETIYTFEVAEKLGYSKNQVIEAIDLMIAYNQSNDEIEFLLENNFKGTENFGIQNIQNDGFGHKIVKSYSVDFFKKEIEVIIGSSDD